MNVEGYKLTKNGDIGLSTIQIGCDCGICGHRLESECIRNECKCCSNFHIRSG